jgi:hypothetical protein
VFYSKLPSRDSEGADPAAVDSISAGSGRQLLPREHGRQKPEFGLHFGGIGHSIGDFLAKEFAIL